MSNLFVEKYFSRHETKTEKLKSRFSELLNDESTQNGVREAIETDLNSGMSVDYLYQKWILNHY